MINPHQNPAQQMLDEMLRQKQRQLDETLDATREFGEAMLTALRGGKPADTKDSNNTPTKEKTE